MRFFYLSVLMLFSFYIANCQQYKSYKTPSAALVQAFNEPITGDAIISPNGEILLIHTPCYFGLANQLKNNHIPLAGEFIDTFNYSNVRQLFDTSLVFYQVGKKAEIKLDGLPQKLKISYLKWSPDGKSLAFCNVTRNETELWICDIGRRKAEKLNKKPLNGFFKPEPFVWMNDSKRLITYYINKSNAARTLSNGPLVFDNKATWGNLADNALLIQSAGQVQNFLELVNARLVIIAMDGLEEEIGPPGLLKHALPSPDGQFFLVEQYQQPFSFTAPYNAFPVKVEVWDQHGSLFRELFELPSTENRAFGPGATVKTPRNINWQPFEPSTLYWIKAADGGNPENMASVRDQLYLFQMPFDGDPTPVADFGYRCQTIYWGTNKVCIVKEMWPLTGETNLVKVNLATGQGQTITTYNSFSNDSLKYDFVANIDYAGNNILVESGKAKDLWAKGLTVNQKGEFAYLLSMSNHLSNLQVLWKAIEPYCEDYIGVVDADKTEIVTLRQSNTDFPNYFTRNLKTGVVEQITNRMPQFDLKQKPYTRFVSFPINDSSTIYGYLSLPPGYQVGIVRLPVLVYIRPHLRQEDENPVFSNTTNAFWQFQNSNFTHYALNQTVVLSIPELPFAINRQGRFEPNMVSQLNNLGKAIGHYLDSLPYTDKSGIFVCGEGMGASQAVWFAQNFNWVSSVICISGIYDKQNPLWGILSGFNFFEPFELNNLKRTGEKKETSFLIIDGSLSPTLIEAKQFYIILKQTGYNARLVILPDETMKNLSHDAELHLMWEIENWTKTPAKKR